VYESITDTTGLTPIVRLNRLPTRHRIKAKILAKLEFFNPIGRLLATHIRNIKTTPIVKGKLRKLCAYFAYCAVVAKASGPMYGSRKRLPKVKFKPVSASAMKLTAVIQWTNHSNTVKRNILRPDRHLRSARGRAKDRRRRAGTGCLESRFHRSNAGRPREKLATSCRQVAQARRISCPQACRDLGCIELVEKLLFCNRDCVQIGVSDLLFRAYKRRSCEEDYQQEYPENRFAMRKSLFP
jgi:hypothetical protein